MKNKKNLLLLLGLFLVAGCGGNNNSSSINSNSESSSNSEISSSEKEFSSADSVSSSESISSSNEISSSETNISSSNVVSSDNSISSSEYLSSDDNLSSNTSSSSSSLSSSSNSSESSSSSDINIDVDGLSFEGVSNTKTPKGKYFNPFKDVKVTSSDGTDLTDYLNVSGSVNYGKLGNYTLKYFVNINGKEKSITRKIEVTSDSITRSSNKNNYTSGNVTLGSGSYRKGSGDELDAPAEAKYLDEELLNKPIPTSSWWTTMLTSNYGGSNGIFTNPYRSSFQNDGVEITDGKEGFTQYWTDAEGTVSTAQFYVATKDILFKASSLNPSYYTKVIDYSDNTAKIAMRNTLDGEDEMVITYAQGSPYIFAEQKEKTGKFNLAIAGATKPYEFYDLNLNKIDNTYTGDGIIVKIPELHVGYTCDIPTTPNSTLPRNPIYQDKYYLINTPSNTTFTISREKHSNEVFFDCISYTLGDGNYLSIGSINSLQEASFYHKHGYSLIQKSNSNYVIDYANSDVITTYTQNYSSLNGDSTNSIVALMPHQYKNSSVSLTDKTYKTIRGDFKVYDGNIFETKQSFYGMLPGYTVPTDSSFSKSQLEEYFVSLDNNTNSTFGDIDDERKGPYWDAKTIYPLAQGLLIADQINNNEYKQKFLTKLENYLKDWFTYDGASDEKYLYYNEVYKTMYYSNNDFNTASSLNDHHFTHGYLVISAAIASMYDNNFFNEYKDIINMLLKDYANPSRDDDTYPYLRTFDKWFGHSWADGFGSASEGNNQESSGEALNSWVAAYTFGLINNDQDMIDAAIYGYTTELNSIKQYVFNYDQDIWSSEYKKTADVCCITWGGKNTDATFFGLNPSFIYGIHWLPIGEYVSGYAITDSDKVALERIYNSYLDKKVGFTDTWMSNMRCIEALINPTNAINNFNANAILNDDYPNDLVPTYYNIYASKSMGLRTDDLYLKNANNVGWDVFKKDNSTYYVQVFNPSNTTKSFVVCDENGNEVKTISVNASSFEKVEIKL